MFWSPLYKSVMRLRDLSYKEKWGQMLGFSLCSLHPQVCTLLASGAKAQLLALSWLPIRQSHRLRCALLAGLASPAGMGTGLGLGLHFLS